MEAVQEGHLRGNHKNSNKQNLETVLFHHQKLQKFCKQVAATIARLVFTTQQLTRIFRTSVVIHFITHPL
jgi:hypothetical protein